MKVTGIVSKVSNPPKFERFICSLDFALIGAQPELRKVQCQMIRIGPSKFRGSSGRACVAALNTAFYGWLERNIVTQHATQREDSMAKNFVKLPLPKSPLKPIKDINNIFHTFKCAPRLVKFYFKPSHSVELSNKCCVRKIYWLDRVRGL